MIWSIWKFSLFVLCGGAVRRNGKCGGERTGVRRREGDRAGENQKEKCGEEGKRRKSFSLPRSVAFTPPHSRSFSSALPVPPHRATAADKQRKFSKSIKSSDHWGKKRKTDFTLTFTKETIGFYFQRATLEVDSLWFLFEQQEGYFVTGCFLSRLEMRARW